MLQTNVAQLASCARVSRARVSAPEKTNAHRHLQTIRFGAPRRDEMTSSRERVAVVIVSHNSAGWLAPCLSSVYAKSGNLDLDVVVVDSGSTDDTVDLVRREFPDVRVLDDREPWIRGGEQPRARGRRRGLGPLPQSRHPDSLGDARGARLRASGTPDRGAGRGQADRRKRRHGPDDAAVSERRSHALRQPRRGTTSDSRLMARRTCAATAHSTSAKLHAIGQSARSCSRARTAIDAVGGMDERFFLYCEETDLCLRIRQAGWIVVHFPR